MRQFNLGMLSVLLLSMLLSPFALDAQVAARRVGGVLPGGPVVPVIPPGQQAVLDTWEAAYTTIFNSPYDAATVRFDLTTTVNGTGLYAGFNQSGEAFELSVISAVDIDPSAVGLSTAALQEIADQNITWGSVSGTVSTSLGSYALQGMVLSRQSATIPFESVLFPVQDEVPPLPWTP